jgi:hypothetical protein
LGLFMYSMAFTEIPWLDNIYRFIMFINLGNLYFVKSNGRMALGICQVKSYIRGSADLCAE